MITNERFTTTTERRRVASAEEVVAEHQARVTAAQDAVTSAKETASASPSERTFAKAKDARRALEDAEEGLTLAQDHASRAAAEVAEVARSRTAAELARLESSLTEVDDDEAREAAVAIVAAVAQLRDLMLGSVERRRAQLAEASRLRALIGAPAVEVPRPEALLERAMKGLVETSLAAQAQRGLRARDLVGAFGGLPLFRADGAPWGAQEYVAGHNYSSLSDPERPAHAARVISEAAELLERVEARRAAPEKAARTGAGIAAAAAVAALAVVAATNLAGG